MGILDKYNLKSEEKVYNIPSFTNVDQFKKNVIEQLKSFDESSSYDFIYNFIKNNLVYIANEIENYEIIKRDIYRKFTLPNFIKALNNYIIYNAPINTSIAMFIHFIYYGSIHEGPDKINITNEELKNLLKMVDPYRYIPIVSAIVKDENIGIAIVNEYYRDIRTFKGGSKLVAGVNYILAVYDITDIQTIVDVYSVFFLNMLSAISNTVFFEYPFINKRKHLETYDAIKTAYYEILDSVPTRVILEELSNLIFNCSNINITMSEIYSIPKCYTRIWNAISQFNN